MLNLITRFNFYLIEVYSKKFIHKKFKEHLVNLPEPFSFLFYNRKLDQIFICFF